MKTKNYIILFAISCPLIISCGSEAPEKLPTDVITEILDTNSIQAESIQSNSYILLEEMGGNSGFDRKKIVQFVRDEIGVVGNNIGKVSVDDGQSTIELKGEAKAKVVAYFASINSDNYSIVEPSDFVFTEVGGSTTKAKDNRDTGTESDHYGSEGPHGSGESHSGDRVADRCHDGG